MSYLVLARKWRPQTFEEMVGQNHAVTTIRNAIASNRVAHAYLFSGPRGVGKTSLARIMAKALNCDRGPTADPCQECSHCIDITQGGSLDVYEIDGASNRGIDEIRELKENVQYLPSSSRYKIYIIDEVHMLTKEAFNALLKTLEEPPGHVIFIFATTEVHKVPVTILSRCQKFDFRRVSTGDLYSHLMRIAEREKIPAEPKALMAIAREAEGGVRDSLSLLDQVLSYSPERVTYQTVMEVLGFVDQGLILDLLHKVIAGDMSAIVEIVDRLHMGGYDLKQFYKNLLEEVRNLLAIQINPASHQHQMDEPEERAAREKLLSMVSRHWLLAAFNQLLAVDAELRYGSYPKFTMELALFKLAHLNEFLSVDRLLSGLDETAPSQPSSYRLSEPDKETLAGEPKNNENGGCKSVPASPLQREEPPVQEKPSTNPASSEPVSSEQFLRFVEQDSPPQASILGKAKISLDNGNVLAVRFPAGAKESAFLNEEHIRSLASLFFKRAIVLNVTREAGEEIQRAVSREDRIEEQRFLRRKALEHPLVQQITDILGARLAEVQPKPEFVEEKESTDG